MDISYSSILPEIVLSVTGIILMLAIPFVAQESQAKLGYWAALGILLAASATAVTWDARSVSFGGMIFNDPFARFAKLLFLLAGGAIILQSISYLEREKLLKAEYFSLLLFSTVGMCLMAASGDLIVTFLGIEILSIATYVLAGYRTSEMKSTESALKYFVLGAFSTAFLLYGIALVYGSTGSTKYLLIRNIVGQAQVDSLLLFGGLALVVVGFGFKVALVPFHVWTPDVYEGAPVPITTHLAVASKAAAVIAFLRLMYQVFLPLQDDWSQILWVSAVLTMLLGNLAALTQTNIKRMLAYSSIAHAGYLLVGITAHNELGAQGVLFYLLAYAFMNLGAFTVVQVFSRKDEQFVEIRDYSGIGFQHPFLSVSLSVFMVSLAGIPATAGFTGKLFLFSAAISNRMYWLVILAVVASAIGIYYYVRLLVVMFMENAPSQHMVISLSPVLRILIAFMVAGTIYLGLFPGAVLKLASEAVRF